MNCRSIEFLELSNEILSRGSCLRFRARGRSMYPFIRDGDILEVEPVNGREIRLGDVIFYQDVGRGMIAHRVIKKSFHNGRLVFVTKGDSSPGYGESVLLEKILGRVVAIERNGRKIRFDSGIGRLMSIFFATFSPFSKGIYPPLRKIKHNLLRKKRKVEDEYLVSLCQTTRLPDYQTI